MRSRVRSGRSWLLRVAGIGLALAACADPEPRAVAPGEAIEVARIPATAPAEEWDSPRGAGWSRVQQYRIDLYAAPPVHPSVALRQVPDPEPKPSPVFVRVAASPERFWLHLHWPDATRDVENAFERFADAAALEFALEDAARTSFMMGSPDAPVNIWHWRASAEGAQNLAAGGFGSLTSLPEQDVSAAGEHANGEAGGWTVVFSRDRDASGEHSVKLAPGASVGLALAIWQGSDRQRDGHKLASPGWLELRFPDSLTAHARN